MSEKHRREAGAYAHGSSAAGVPSADGAQAEHRDVADAGDQAGNEIVGRKARQGMAERGPRTHDSLKTIRSERKRAS